MVIVSLFTLYQEVLSHEDDKEADFDGNKEWVDQDCEILVFIAWHLRVAFIYGTQNTEDDEILRHCDQCHEGNECEFRNRLVLKDKSLGEAGIQKKRAV